VHERANAALPTGSVDACLANGAGYALFLPTLVTGVLFIGLSAIVLWRFAVRREIPARTNEA
jgi:hypothetical protein